MLAAAKLGEEYIAAGTAVRLVCTKPLMSPSPDSSGAPDGGLIRERTAVSSMPLTIGVMVMVPPESQFVRLLVPYRVAPVPYIIRLELNGSIASTSVIQPSRGVTTGGEGFPLKVSHGTEEMFWV